MAILSLFVILVRSIRGGEVGLSWRIVTDGCGLRMSIARCPQNGLRGLLIQENSSVQVMPEFELWDSNGRQMLIDYLEVDSNGQVPETTLCQWQTLSTDHGLALTVSAMRRSGMAGTSF